MQQARSIALGLMLVLAAAAARAQAEDEELDFLRDPQDEGAAPEIVATIPVESAAGDAAAAPPPAAPRSRLVEEIVVTAQKREESLQDVPISVQAFSAAQLDVRGVLDVKDLPQITPGLTVTTQVNYTSTFIRGIGSDAFLLGDPSVANYVDGIYFPFSNNLVKDFGIIERVEVLKGPQGTLFGRNAVGGAINAIQRAPSLERVELAVQSSYGDYDAYRNRAYISLPLFGVAGISLSGVYNDAESHIDGISGGAPLPRERAKGGRVGLRLAPVDWLRLDLAGFRIEQQGTGTNYSPNVAPSLLAQLGGVEPQDPYAGEVNESIFFSYDDETVYGSLQLLTDWFDIKLLGSDQYVETFANYDFDGSPQALALFQVEPVFADVQTAEFQILSNATTWGADRFRWILGAYYFRSRQGFGDAFLRSGSTSLDDGFVLGVALPPPLLDAIRTLLGGAPVPSGDIGFIGLIDTESLAGFGQATFDVTDWFAVTVGGRYQDEERVLVESTSEFRNLDGSTVPIQSFSGIDDPRFRDTTTSFDPKIALELRPGSGLLGTNPLIYASWQTATKSSTYNVVNIYDEPDYVRPEEMRAYELGAKLNLFDGLLGFNVAVFDYRLDDQQVQFVSLLEGGAVTFENAASVAVRGIDVDGMVQLFPSRIDDLNLIFGAAWLDAVYDAYPQGSGFDENTGLLSSDNDFTGNRVVRTPEFSGNLGLYKTFRTGLGVFELGADYYYNSGFFYLAQNRASDEEDAFDILNARISWLWEPWKLRLTAFGQNLLDTKYNYSRFIADYGTNDARAPLANYGLRLNWDFGL
jgi:iron complex outermembrane recepter protein